jgi:hypothetical protein
MEERDAAPIAGPAPGGPRASAHATIEEALGADVHRWTARPDAGYACLLTEWALEGPLATASFSDAAGAGHPARAALRGQGGLDGEAPGTAFGQDQAAEVLRPGPALAALTEGALSDLGALSDDQLTGALLAARRLENRAAYLQTVAIAEFARRREVEREEAKSRRVPLHCRPGQFPGEELAAELVCTARYADERIWEATDLATRLPRTLAGMADGTIDAIRAYVIWSYTWSLSSQDAARADEILAPAAPGLRPDQLGRKAAALEMKLDPEAVKRRREHARQDGQRVEVKHERSGNAMLAGRELDPVTALAAKANIDALAVKLRDASREGSLQHLRALVMTELLQGRNPVDHLTATSPPEPAGPEPGDWQDDPGYRDEDGGPDDRSFETDPATRLRRTPAGAVAPLPALVNILVPAGTLLGWSATPAQVGGWGLLDADETRKFTRAASLSPRTRFCLTLVAPDGTALAHGCSRGQHPWLPPRPATAQPGAPPGQRPPPARIADDRRDPPPGPAQAQQLADLIRRLNVTFRPIVKDGCDHAGAEDHYAPSRALRHLIRARTATCGAPACNAQAVYCDLDHTVPYPDGPTCQCNLAPKCRRHHRCKQAAGWKVEQPEPGVLRWTLPSGRTHTTTPTGYDL